MKCVICGTTGTPNPKEIALQSTTSGSVCPTCINQLVFDVVHMRKPWSERDLKDWGYDKEKDAEYLLDKMVEVELQGEEE